MKELKDLQVGDIVLIRSTFNKRLAKVSKITKTQIVVDGTRYRKESGWQCGNDRWNCGILSIPTEDEIKSIREEELRKRLFYAISDFDFRNLSLDKLRQVYNIIKSE